MKENAKSVESTCCEQQSPSHKENPDGSEELYPDYDAEAAEIHRMKEECDQMIHEMLDQIDMLLAKIDSILGREITDEY